MRVIKLLLSLLIICIAAFPLKGYCASMENLIIPCTPTGQSLGSGFKNATISIDNIDQTGQFIYSGADLGIFKKLASGDTWETVYVKRIMTDSLKVTISDFGDTSLYNSASVYSIGYRVLYRPVGVFTNPINEADWNRVQNCYFKVTHYLSGDNLTDRVTGANRWMSDTQADKLNLYTPDSEVMSRFVLNPKGASIDDYNVEVDCNLSNELIKISKISIAKIQIEGETTTLPIPTVTVKDNHTITFNIHMENAYKKKKVNVYFRYTFKKLNKTPLPNNKKTILNTVKVKAIGGGSSQDINLDNTIRIRDVKIIYG